MDIYQVLGISPTRDKKVIRKAYAGLIRKYHPEEHPEKWKEIHDAYMSRVCICAVCWTSTTPQTAVSRWKK